MRITEKGQVTIPGAIRRKEGLLPGTEVDFVSDEHGVRIVPRKNGRSRTKRENEVADALDRLRGSATIRMTTEEIMALTRGE
jgi:AbrB family looped-hinge helix DNA binding protein